MSDVILDGINVTICDWRGHLVWRSADKPSWKPGDLVWKHLVSESMHDAKQAFAKVVALGEAATLELENKRGHHFRVWLWPLERPEIAVCMLSVMIPKELKTLTEREREILGLLALGYPTREIAEKLDVSASTVHTHLRRARQKLSLPSVESLTGFAARYCHPGAAPTHSLSF
ncbi:helix-turn-helix transcriptional regulator [Rhodopirellula sp. JC639]|uniref:helix-turn-helix transcriptional regulator n=1 Tax=Stieleria mannarensis TaxID=2755585 RepID=UPI0016042424|nr:helix-turn-helix transcriptional regulator [Rhodopirellula sp. JC639]